MAEPSDRSNEGLAPPIPLRDSQLPHKRARGKTDAECVTSLTEFAPSKLLSPPPHSRREMPLARTASLSSVPFLAVLHQSGTVSSILSPDQDSSVLGSDDSLADRVTIRPRRRKPHKRGKRSDSMDPAFQMRAMSSEDERDHLFIGQDGIDDRLREIYNILGTTEEKKRELTGMNTIAYRDPSEFLPDEANPTAPEAASFRQLILWLCDMISNTLDQSDFILTFPSFETPQNVLAALFTRFYADRWAEGSNISSKDFKVVQDRIIRWLSSWMKIGTVYQWQEKGMKDAIKQFVLYLGMDGKRSEVRKLVIEGSFQKLEGTDSNRVIYSDGEAPKPLIPKGTPEHWTIGDVKSLEIARQITLYHMGIFRAIVPTELFAAIWNETKGVGAPHINELTKHFDRFSRLVQLEILEKPSAKERAKEFWHWVEVAEELRKMQNFHGMFSVVCGLTHRSVSRLPETMKLVGKAGKKEKKVLAYLTDLCDFSEDYAKYREMYKNVTDEYACIPFIGCLQKDLIYVQEGFPNRIKGLINFKKSRECVRLLSFVSQRQMRRYNFVEIEKIKELCVDFPEPPDTTELMKLSTEKEKKKEK